MTDPRKDLLIQQYEEAALGLLMEEYADAEGAFLLQGYEAASREDTAASMPQELADKCLKLIDRAYMKRRRGELLSGIAKSVGKLAVFAAIFCGLISVSVLSVEAWRVPVLNFILDESGDFASINFENADSQPPVRFAEIVDRVTGVVPAGYELMNQPDVDGLVMNMRLCNAEDNRILVTVHSSTSELVVDTENATCTELEFDGHRAVLIQKDYLHIVWCDERAQLVYSVYADGLTADGFWELVHLIAE